MQSIISIYGLINLIFILVILVIFSEYYTFEYSDNIYSTYTDVNYIWYKRFRNCKNYLHFKFLCMVIFNYIIYSFNGCRFFNNIICCNFAFLHHVEFTDAFKFYPHFIKKNVIAGMTKWFILTKKKKFIEQKISLYLVIMKYELCVALWL